MNRRTQTRLAWLEQALTDGGTIHLADAAGQLGVSEMTIRRDVEASAGRLTLLAGRVLRADNPRYTPLYDLVTEHGSHQNEKKRICAAAAQQIAPDDTVFIDCGTTLVHMAAALAPDISLTVVTYALNVANAFSALPNIRLVVLGGLYHASSQSFSDENVDSAIRHIGVNKAFISAAGIHFKRGVSCFHFHEAPPKQAALKIAQQRILVADSSKLQQVRPVLFAQWADFDVFITNTPHPDDSPLAANQPGPDTIIV